MEKTILRMQILAINLEAKSIFAQPWNPLSEQKSPFYQSTMTNKISYIPES